MKFNILLMYWILAPIDEERTSPNGSIGSNSDKGEILNTKQRHQVKHRELFLSRQVETLPATHIRGKCSVTLLNETESLTSYLNKEVSRKVQSKSFTEIRSWETKHLFCTCLQDTFFYCLVFDPNQRTLLADKGEIRVGNRYQTEITPLLKENESDGRDIENLETLVWTPNHSLSDRKIDQFLVVSRSVGTFARALDCSSSVKQPSLHMSAAAASRDITLVSVRGVCGKTNYVNFTLSHSFSFMPWILCTNIIIRSRRQCVRWCRQVDLYCVATKWKSGVHRKLICLKRL